jgi:hypothetical protein
MTLPDFAPMLRGEAEVLIHDKSALATKFVCESVASLFTQGEVTNRGVTGRSPARRLRIKEATGFEEAELPWRGEGEKG